MKQPLPDSLAAQKPGSDYNAGLWYDKFCNQWCRDPQKEGSDCWSLESFTQGKGKNKITITPKDEWIAGTADHLVGNSSLLDEQRRRLRTLVSARGGRLLYFQTEARFVTGLGRAHPVENGFAWHHTLGTPYLPGSSLKGLMRAWAQEQGEQEPDINRIFGPRGQREPACGSVVFFDALPTQPVRLEAEVMTPHYGPYYQDEAAKTPPADWHDPVPIPFLAVAAAQPFIFAFAPRRRHEAQDSADCAAVAGWLKEALAWLGAGAKTSVGYGRFRLDSAVTEAAAEEQRQAEEQRRHEAALAERLRNLSPLAQQLEREIDQHHLERDKNAFNEPPFIEQWLDKLEADPATDALERFCGLMNAHFSGLLENPDKTKGKKNKFVFKDRQRKNAERLLALKDQQR